MLGMDFALLCDFDGAVAERNIMRGMLRLFAHGSWQKADSARRDGVISQRECLEKQVSLIRASRRRLDAFLMQTPLRRGFVEFVTVCRQAGLDLTIISNGLDYAVHMALAGNGLYDLPVIANRLEFKTWNSYGVSFPHSAVDCGLGVCKCNAAMEKDRPILLIGGGVSDCCLADMAALTLVRKGGALHRHCRRVGLQYMIFEDFFEVRTLLNDLFRHGPAHCRGCLRVY
jgi:2-hydroxy-3-keto-5-methylthiopentenyl-1-phosphate phosphatase